MTPTTTLRALHELLEPLQVRWVLIGALAANRYRGSPRMTGDVDLLLADFGESLANLEEALRSAGWSVHRADSEGELVRISHADFGSADLLVAGTDYQHKAIERAVTEEVDQMAVSVLTPEDVIIHKLIAGRFQDLADVESILETSIELDQPYLEGWVRFWQVEELWKQLNQK